MAVCWAGRMKCWAPTAPSSSSVVVLRLSVDVEYLIGVSAIAVELVDVLLHPGQYCQCYHWTHSYDHVAIIGCYHHDRCGYFQIVP